MMTWIIFSVKCLLKGAYKEGGDLPFLRKTDLQNVMRNKLV